MGDSLDDMTAFWKEQRAEQRERKAKRLPVRQGEIRSLAAKGFKVVQITEYQFRVNDVLDLYPTHNRYHSLKTGRRGGYPSATQFVESFFNGRKHAAI